MSLAKLEIYLDETVEDSDLFKSKSEFKICKSEIFKYGIMLEEVPDHIKESDFDHLQSKIPAYELLHSEFITVLPTQIQNLSKDDRKKKTLSEIIGVAFGIKYSVELLNTNPNKFKKIGVPEDGKYLDYALTLDGKTYELETKGTVGTYYNKFKKDILAKKVSRSAEPVYLRFGTIAMINNPGDVKNSRCVVVDDPPDENNRTGRNDTFKTQLLNYAMFLSYILDSKYYNRYIKPLKRRATKRVRINEQKFYTKYSFQGKDYFGECFDYRLIKDYEDVQKNTQNLYEKQTKKYGKTKFFIGLDYSIIEAINSRDIIFLDQYESEWACIEEAKTSKFLDKDGILIVKSKDGGDKQLEKIFSEEEVIRRLGLQRNFVLGISHKCGEPCRSPQLRGKACEIRTFRDKCHFHR